jgi:hypothetical protein
MMRIRNTNWLLRALSLVTLVALVVAPACAPLCAAQNCQRASASGASHGNCHGANPIPHEAPWAHAIMGCGSQELPAVVLVRTPLGDDSSASRLSGPDGMLLAVQQENSASAATFSDFYFGPPHDFFTGFVPVPSSVLRI